MGVTAPSKPQLALALAVVKQKPPHRDLRDYISEIRLFIKRSRELGHGGSLDKFFDSVSFWQQAYEESEARQSKLHDQVHDLQQKIDDLVGKLRAKHADGTEASQINKRKAPLPRTGRDTGNLNSTTKRAKIPGSLSQRHIWMDDDDESGDENALCTSRQLYTLQRALQRRSTSDSSLGDLTAAAVILCKSAEQQLISAVQRESTPIQQSSTQPKPDKSNAPDTDIILNGVILAFHLAHKALKKLAANAQSRQHQAQITYYLVGLFESCMTALTLHCTSISAQVEQKKEKNTRCTESQLASHLADALYNMTLALDLTHTEDQDIMEGLLFLVLRRMGRMLALHVFHDIRLPMSVCPGMTYPEGLEAMADEGLMPTQAQVETRYLIRVLSRMLDIECDSSPKALASRQFIENVKDRLQKTLLQAVFGPDDHMFREILLRPQTPPPVNSSPVEQEKFGDWLTQELWRLVGWDVLKSMFASK
ncbi:unnamed protein product [Penicillium salamii]|uniref:Uncharacterized protein n=1 Tax=Penicillium salamii TaxID=1612424 RepID=A0A9W4IW46_9EURO|nr:unnamed protein product [Penicillium salamii]CAG8049178.1 unnamed protein product [Penicillium salamii]CAG8334048.1 unnamed protein product [Penicillium salamii]CAG8350402.1 unnamed protein product [Penicillium salamii]CAG8350428.1 unnamed protein product [Penicillium salamii]